MKRKKRVTALLMAGVMLLSGLPVNVFAVERSEAVGLCEHHPEHTAECGYTESGGGVLRAPMNTAKTATVL